jgi:ABC-2 type transport system ATP-binding protein
MHTGVLHPSGGTATVLVYLPWDQRRELTRHIGTLFGQRSQLWFELTPRQSYRMLGAIYGLDDDVLRARVGALGDLLDAGDLFDRPARNLSLGERMRCELAACLLHEPRILFLDEPTIGLDLVGKQRFRELLLRVNDERRTTIFLTSHDVADIEHVAERAIVINHGTVIFDASVATMRRTLLATKLVEVSVATPADVVATAGVTVVGHTPTTVRLAVDTGVAPIRDVVDGLLSSYDLTDLTVTDPPLEQVIAEIYETGRPAS